MSQEPRGKQRKSHTRCERIAWNIIVTNNRFRHVNFYRTRDFLSAQIKSENFTGSEGSYRFVFYTRHGYPDEKSRNARNGSSVRRYAVPMRSRRILRRPRFLAFLDLTSCVQSFVARIGGISPGAVAVALYFIFMQKRQITSRRGARLADQKPSARTWNV